MVIGQLPLGAFPVSGPVLRYGEFEEGHPCHHELTLLLRKDSFKQGIMLSIANLGAERD